MVTALDVFKTLGLSTPNESSVDTKKASPFAIPRRETLASPQLPKTTPEQKGQQGKLASALMETVFFPFEMVSRGITGVVSGKAFKPEFNLLESPTVGETVEKATAATPLGKIPGVPFVFGLAAEVAVPGPGEFKKGAEVSKEVAEAATKRSTKRFVERTTKEVANQKGAKEVLELTTAKVQKEILEQRRGVITDAELQRLASGEVGILDRLASAPPGTVQTAEQNLRMKQEVADKLLRALKLTGPKRIEELTSLAAIEPQVLGVAAETGRALAAFGKGLAVGTDEFSKELLKGLNEVQDLAARESLKKLARFVKGKEPGLLDQFVEWATAIKLTSPLTQFRNASGNTFSTMLRFPEKVVAGGYDAVKAAILGKERSIYAREVIPEFVGMVSGFKEGAAKAARALKDETYALRAGRAGEALQFSKGAIPGKFGKVVRSPFRLLTATDQFFRTVNESASLYALATRKALQEELSGVELAQRVDDLVRNPPQDFLRASRKEASKVIFQQDLDKFTKYLNGAREKFPILKVVTPFWKTPVNVFKAVIERTPLSLTLPSTIRGLKKGGATQAELISKMLVGSGMMSAFTLYAMEGGITGRGPDNKNERDALYRQGWQPYSVKIGDKYISYRGLEPLTGYLGLASDIAETGKAPNDQQALNIIAAIVGDFVDQPFLTGAADLLEAIQEPERKGEKFVSDTIGGATVPTGVSWFTRLVDPVFRKPKGFLQRMEARLPILSEEVPAVMNAFGEEARREGGILQRLSPVPLTTGKLNTVEKELKRINYTMGFPSKTAFSEKLTDEEYETLLRVSGQVAFATLDKLFQSQGYQYLNETQKEKQIEKVVRDVREQVRKRAFAEKEIQREIRARIAKDNRVPEEQREAVLEYIMNQIELKARPK